MLSKLLIFIPDSLALQHAADFCRNVLENSLLVLQNRLLLSECSWTTAYNDEMIASSEVETFFDTVT